MADEQNTPPGASIADVVVALNQANRNSSLLVQTMSSVLPRITGSFTLSAAATTTVTQPAVKANSVINWNNPTNAAAATLMGGTKALYLSGIVAGASFSLTTANGTAAAGTEAFQYFIFNPA